MIEKGHDYASIAGNNLPIPQVSAGPIVVNRAYHKIAEAARRSPLLAAALASPAAGGIAIDVGAAPGGWTAYLAEACSKVLFLSPRKDCFTAGT